MLISPTAQLDTSSHHLDSARSADIAAASLPDHAARHYFLLTQRGRDSRSEQCSMPLVAVGDGPRGELMCIADARRATNGLGAASGLVAVGRALARSVPPAPTAPLDVERVRAVMSTVIELSRSPLAVAYAAWPWLFVGSRRGCRAFVIRDSFAHALPYGVRRLQLRPGDEVVLLTAAEEPEGWRTDLPRALAHAATAHEAAVAVAQLAVDDGADAATAAVALY